MVGREGSRIIGHAAGTHGAIHFTPGYGPAGRRRVEALVERDGVPRLRTRIATYLAPAPARPARVKHLRISRRKTTLRVGWSAAAGATFYLVRIELSNGRHLVRLLGARAHSLALSAVAKSTHAKVTIRASDAHGRAGPTSTKRG